jgi:hypothetical protein
VYRPAQSEKVIGMTILGARVVLVLRAQGPTQAPSGARALLAASPPERFG